MNLSLKIILNVVCFFSIISETLNSSGRHMETIQASEPSTLDMVAGTDKDEVQVSFTKCLFEMFFQLLG
jgi:hypothetical protein